MVASCTPPDHTSHPTTHPVRVVSLQEEWTKALANKVRCLKEIPVVPSRPAMFCTQENEDPAKANTRARVETHFDDLRLLYQVPVAVWVFTLSRQKRADISKEEVPP